MHEIWDRIRHEVEGRNEVTGRANTVLDLLMSVSREMDESDVTVMHRAFDVARGRHENSWDAPIRRSGAMDPREFRDRLGDKLNQLEKSLHQIEDGSRYGELLQDIWDRMCREIDDRGRITRRANSAMDLLLTIGKELREADVGILRRSLDVLRGGYDQERGASIGSIRQMPANEYEYRLDKTLRRIHEGLRDSRAEHEFRDLIDEIRYVARDKNRRSRSGEASDRAMAVLDLLESVRIQSKRRFVRKKYKRIEDLVLDWNSIADQSVDRSDWFVAEYKCKKTNSPKTSDGFFARVWNEHVRMPLIPHNLNERKRVLSHLWGSDNFSRHLQHWESLRSKAKRKRKKKA